MQDDTGRDMRHGGDAHPTSCEQCPLMGCEGLEPPSREDRAGIERYKMGEIALKRGTAVFIQGAPATQLHTVLRGVLIRYRALPDGRRQIVNFMFPGDLVGLQSALDEPMSHGVEALSDVTLCSFPRAGFRDFIAAHPQLGFDTVWIAAREEAALEDHLLSLGRRNALERIANLAIFLLRRAQASCVADGNRLPLVVTQTQIADMLGLSLVHTHRSIQALRKENLVHWTLNEIYVPDMAAACDFAQFDGRSDAPRPYI